MKFRMNEWMSAFFAWARCLILARVWVYTHIQIHIYIYYLTYITQIPAKQVVMGSTNSATIHSSHLPGVRFPPEGNSSSKLSVSGAKFVLGWFPPIALCWFRVENCLEAIIKVMTSPKKNISCFMVPVNHDSCRMGIYVKILCNMYMIRNVKTWGAPQQLFFFNILSRDVQKMVVRMWKTWWCDMKSDVKHLRGNNDGNLRAHPQILSGNCTKRPILPPTKNPF